MGLIKKLPRPRPASGDLLHLDLMRFIASAGIVFHHSHEFFAPVAKRPYLLDQTAGLALFVDLFFVISGFVIAYIYHERMNSIHDYVTFLQRRAGRLVPLHWLTLLASITVWSMFGLLHYPTAHTPSFKPECIAETASLFAFIRILRKRKCIQWCHLVDKCRDGDVHRVSSYRAYYWRKEALDYPLLWCRSYDFKP